MEQFGFIEAIKLAAENKGWKFYLGIDNYYENAVLKDEMANGDIALVVRSNATPTWSGLSTGDITYSNRVMIGRKFDPDGLSASLDETYQQKYDRRLKDLETELDTFLKTFKCDNELDLGTHSGYQHGINLFDQNIDFVIINNITFIG